MSSSTPNAMHGHGGGGGVKHPDTPPLLRAEDSRANLVATNVAPESKEQQQQTNAKKSEPDLMIGEIKVMLRVWCLRCWCWCCCWWCLWVL